jgi:hypothetical protein
MTTVGFEALAGILRVFPSHEQDCQEPEPYKIVQRLKVRIVYSMDLVNIFFKSLCLRYEKSIFRPARGGLVENW